MKLPDASHGMEEFQIVPLIDNRAAESVNQFANHQ